MLVPQSPDVKGAKRADVRQNPGMEFRQIAATMIAAATFTALAIGGVPGLRVSRAAIALLGAGAVLALGVVPMRDALKTIDLHTIVLLLSMMVINAVLELSGFFTWVGNLIIDKARTPVALLVVVVLTGGVLSALFINDPVVLMLTPLVCTMTMRLRLNPVPYLVALATAANIGSSATITGNPQNILIGTSSGIPYLVFLVRLAPIALIGMAIVVGVVLVTYSGRFSLAASPAQLLDQRPEHSAPRPRKLSLQEAETLVYVPVLRKALLVVGALLIAFLAGVDVSLAAYLAACALLLTRRIKTQRILNLIDWNLLVLFGGLFVVTGALELTGVSERLFDLVRGIATGGVVPLTVAATVLSNTISNVPAVLLFRPLMGQFADPERAWLTLASASTLAGNLTLIGSVANLIVAEQALKFGVRLSFGEYLRAGVPVTLLSLAVAVAWLTLAF